MSLSRKHALEYSVTNQRNICIGNISVYTDKKDDNDAPYAQNDDARNEVAPT